MRRRVDRLTYDTQQEANTRLSRDAEEDRTRSVDTRPSLARSGAADAFKKFRQHLKIMADFDRKRLSQGLPLL